MHELESWVLGAFLINAVAELGWIISNDMLLDGGYVPVYSCTASVTAWYTCPFTQTQTKLGERLKALPLLITLVVLLRLRIYNVIIRTHML